MDIYLNNEIYSLEKDLILAGFFRELNIDLGKGIAIAVNDSVIPRSEWNKTSLKDKDKITLIKATAGG